MSRTAESVPTNLSEHPPRFRRWSHVQFLIELPGHPVAVDLRVTPPVIVEQGINPPDERQASLVLAADATPGCGQHTVARPLQAVSADTGAGGNSSHWEASPLLASKLVLARGHYTSGRSPNRRSLIPTRTRASLEVPVSARPPAPRRSVSTPLLWSDRASSSADPDRWRPCSCLCSAHSQLP